jgi:two-component system CitB family sensor kinase
MPRTRWYARLFTQTLALQLAVLAVVLAFMALAFSRYTRVNLERQYGERALAVAQSVAAIPDVRKLVADADSWKVLQPLAEEIRESTGVSFVVIADEHGIRRSHPNPDEIGQRVSTDPGPALQGVSDVYTQVGTLGPSVRGKAPIWSDSDAGEIIGLVSVGVLTGAIDEAAGRQLPALLAFSGGALALGALGSWVIARRVRRQTLGLEPAEIAALFENREAMLLGIREGVVGVDGDGCLNLINQEAVRLLEIDGEAAVLGKPVTAVIDSSPITQIVEAPDPQQDVAVAFGDRILLINAMPVQVRSERVGTVITLRDHTELEDLVNELENAHSVVDALRAQAHEFSNTLHAVAGLIELGKGHDALEFITDQVAIHQGLTTAYRDRIGDPLLVALLLAKSAVASERGIAFQVDAESLEGVRITEPRRVLTVVGNLVDNAFDSVGGLRYSGGRVDVAFRADGVDLDVRVADNGAGVPPEHLNELFDAGFTTKDRRLHSGVGLSLVRQAVGRRAGSIRVSNDGGAVFTAVLPGILQPEELVVG